MIEQRHHAMVEARNRIKDKAKRMIFVTFQKEGIHKYPAAASGTPHRHIFHFNVAIEVFHNDRDIEFIQFKRWLENLYKGGTLELNYKSCEMISDDLYEQIATRYPEREIIITVSEDGENGATIHYNLTQPYQQLAI
jgi:hypothetical protein